MSAVILSHCQTPQMMDISLGNETLQSLITLCSLANRVIFIFLFLFLAQSHPGLSSSLPPTSPSSAVEKPGLKKINRSRGRRRWLSLPKTNRNWEKQRKRTSGGSKANNQREGEATSSPAVAAAASPLTTHRVIPPAIFFFSYLGKLAGGALSPAHIMLFHIITPNQ